MAITITDNALEVWQDMWNSNTVSETHRYFRLLQAHCTYTEDELPIPGTPKPNETLCVLNPYTLNLISCDYLKTLPQERCRVHEDGLNITGYGMFLIETETGNKQLIPGTELYITWSDNDNDTFDGTTIDYDDVREIFTIDFS